jgi:Glycogen recognition site of AMP-activated protein kinase
MGQDNSKNPRQPNSSSPAPDSAKHSSSRRDPRTNLIQASRAPAEPSLAQARGTSATHRPRNSNVAAQGNHPSPSHSINSPSQHSSDSQMGSKQPKTEPKQVQKDQPSKPVDVPTPAANVESGSLRSYSNSIEPSGPPATQDMSYHLTRPPRLPLPIEEEVHTPGSPIIAPADLDAPILDVEALDNEPLPRRASALSNTTIDEEDAEELRVDKTKATVPTTFEWRYGGDKVYVTGTIFQWNKKHRLHPV